MPISPTGKKAFTLIELLIALVLSSFILMGIVSAFSTAIKAKTLLTDNTRNLQIVRQLHQELTFDFGNALMLPRMTESRVKWQPGSVRFVSRDADGKIGVVNISHTGNTIVKTWIPVDISKLPIIAGRQGMTVDFSNVEGMVLPKGTTQYVIARAVTRADFRCIFSSEDETGGKRENKDGTIFIWPQAITLDLSIAPSEGTTPFEAKWAFPLIQESPWHMVKSTDNMSAVQF